jgi:hypothetical protein
LLVWSGTEVAAGFVGENRNRLVGQHGIRSKRREYKLAAQCKWIV